MSNALIIVDVQYDFLPGGALGVPDGDKIIDPIVELVTKGNWDYDVVLASYDWHPKNHMSFVENGGQWPAHCVQDSYGAKIHSRILSEAEYYIEKGGNPEREAYSAFDGFIADGRDINHNDKSPTLDEFLRSREVETVDICGLALDYCVLATALGAEARGYNTSVFLDLTRPVEYLTGARAIESLAGHNINLDTTVHT